MSTIYPGPTEDQLKTMNLYASLLDEARIRIGVIENIVDGRVGLPSPILHETCFLQMRFLCELIALGCLVLHGDIKLEGSTKSVKARLKGEWSAENITNTLANLHPAFYPVPLKSPIKRADGTWHFDRETDDFLTRDELGDLYGQCNRHMHRGSLKRLLKDKMPTQYNFPDVNKWMVKIGRLLRVHSVSLFDPGRLLHATLRSVPHNGRAYVLFAVAKTEGEDIAGV